MEALTEEMLDGACHLFAVNREWLDGESTEIYPLHDFYKQSYEFKTFLEVLLSKSMSGIQGKLFIPSEKDDYGWDEAFFILEEPIGEIGNKIISRYHICNNWFFSYWKARAYLTACIAVAWKNDCIITGWKIDRDLINKYTYMALNFLPLILYRTLLDEGNNFTAKIWR